MTAPKPAAAPASRDVGSPVQPCEPPHYVKIQLVDEAGQPVSGVRFQIRAPDGRVIENVLDEDGMGGAIEIPKGQCTIRFPDLDGAAWELKKG
jgi:hypothetical protein